MSRGVYERPVQRGEVVRLKRHEVDIWMVKTPQEAQAERDRDAKAGRYHDDGGEPILYSTYGGWSLVPEEHEDLVVVVVELVPRAKWHHWSKRPKHLRAAWCPELQRLVMFRSL